MAATLSTMIPLGTKAPDFTLLDTISNKKMSFADLKSEKGTVVMFICNHCPFVQHIMDDIVSLSEEYLAKGIRFIAINSNDVTAYPADAPDKMKELADQLLFSFPYLFDETQEVAKAYHAACTPDFFVFDGEDKCVYRGQFDDSRPTNKLPVNGKDLRAALDNILLGKPVDSDQKPSIGCNIKWK